MAPAGCTNMLSAMGLPNDGSQSDDVSHEELPHAASPNKERRRTLELLVAAGSAVYAGSLVVPAARFLAPTAGADEQGRWIRVAKLDAVKEGQPTRVQLRGEQRDAFTVTADVTLGSVWLTRHGNDVRALSAECPHLGCAVDVASNGANFGCPCHTSRFALDGKAESGPSPRGMDPLTTRVVDGFIEVEFRRFRQGSSERVEVSA
jgi:menaquinol-cytochrome c reductase iron-sulfur subunit